MPPAITLIYAGILALVFIVLSARTIPWRRSQRISVCDGEDREMTKRVRAHANCAEYAPFGLVPMALAELQGLGAVALNVLGAMPVSGSVMNPVGYGQTPQVTALRFGGTVLTLAMLAFAALACLSLSLI